MVFVAVAYLIIAFYFIDFNPVSWGKEGRFFMSLMSIIAIGIGTLTALTINHKEY